MTPQSKRELIQAIRRVYGKASKRQKSQHLDHLERVTEAKRNYLNRLLLAGYKERRKRPGRQSRYARDPEFMTALRCRVYLCRRYTSFNELPAHFLCRKILTSSTTTTHRTD